MHKRVDIFNSISHERLPHHRAIRLWLRLFNGAGKFLLHAFAVSMCIFRFYYYCIAEPKFRPIFPRMLRKSSTLLKSFLVFTCAFFYINHFSYLAVGRFDYSYNMKANVVTGIVTGIGWMAWYTRARAKRPYARKMLIFQVLAAASLLLELKDFPPILWAFDAHSLWHLATAPLTIIFYE